MTHLAAVASSHPPKVQRPGWTRLLLASATQ
jgi:hypothetical protein